MRNLIFLLAFWVSLPVCAQQTPLHTFSGNERYYSLDTNSHLHFTPFAKLKDSLEKILSAAKTAHDYEFGLSLKLFIYVKAYNENLVGSDTTEYNLLELAAQADEKGAARVAADIRQSLGDFYNKYNQQQSAAIEQYSLAYDIYRHFSTLDFPQKKDYLYRLGLALYAYQDYAQSVTYLREALQLNKSTEYSSLYPTANTIGLCYRNMKVYDSAIYYFQRIYDSAVNHNDDVWIGISQGNIGITYFHQKKYAEAEPMLKRDIELSLANSIVKNAVNSMTILATIYYEQGKYGAAEKILLDALKMCHQKFFWQDCSIAENVYGLLYKVYGSKKQYQLSCLYADSALMAKDTAASRYSALSQSKLLEKQNFIRKKLETEQQQNQAKLDRLKKLDQQQLLYKFIIGFLVVVLLVALMVNRFRNHLTVIATNVQDAPEIVVQKMSIVIISIATCAAAVVWALLYYYYYGFCVATLGPIIYFLVIGPSLFFYFFTKKQQFLINVQLICMFTMPIMMEWSNGGFQSGVVINWALLAPVGALMYKGVREAAFWMVLLVIAVISTIVFNESFATYYHPISESGQAMFYGMDIVGPSIIIFFSMQFFVKSTIRDGKLLQSSNAILSNTLDELKLEKQKSDDLLLNILPEEVAEELKEKGTTTAKHFDNVTVLFTDFANFTNAGERMSPQDLINELHNCFKTFDEITAKYNIEKIKTIGDAYLAVAGLPTPDPKHAENVVNAAMEINNFMSKRFLEMGQEHTFKVRIGVHSGSVVAGIVGVKKFAYDIWGDTVNTAARMEQHGEPGKINISQTTYELVKDKISCAYRGEIDVKGKGVMKMYFVS